MVYVTTEFSSGTKAKSSEVNQNFVDVQQGLLGEVRMFALSLTGALTKAQLLAKGWAICDGTTPATQGMSSPTIETTPDLQHHFIRMSNDESSGDTGGADTIDIAHTHSVPREGWGGTTPAAGRITTAGTVGAADDNTSGSGLSATQSILPTYYELAFFLKAKVI